MSLASDDHLESGATAGQVYRDVVEAAPTAIIVVDARARIVLVNRETVRVFGYAREELLGRNVGMLIPAATRADHAAMHQLYMAAPQARPMGAGRDLKGLRKDASEVPIEIALNPIATASGPAVLAIVTDITERKRAEQTLWDLNRALEQRTRELAQELEARRQAEAALVQAQRMEAVGQLTAGVAHDFNNLLQGIFGALSLLKDQPHLDAEGRECVELVDHAARRGATLVHRLLAFSRKQALNPALFRPEQVLAGFAPLVAYSVGDRIRIETIVEEGVGMVHADVAQLENCLFNLAINARDAMPRGGVLRLRVGNARPRAVRAAGLGAGEYVRFAIEDSGAGMDEATLARAFEPFFTTKGVGKGTGLGLPMVQGFARQSGGDVRIESAPGQGTTVSVWLPRAAIAAEKPIDMAADKRRGRDRGRGRVMVVDDEACVRNVLALILAKAGYSPLAVESGEDALGALKAGEACDLLVTDQSMPGMTGIELIDEVGQLRPTLPTMLISGYDLVHGLDELRGHVTLLRKPFEREMFLYHVDMLAGAVAARPGNAS